MPWAVMARMISSQSGRMYASPPMSVISRVPRRAHWRITSRHSSVVSSFGRFFPALDPQCPHFRLQASVSSHTTTTGLLRAKSSSVS